MIVCTYADLEPAFLHNLSPVFMLVRFGDNEKALHFVHMQTDPVSCIHKHDVIDDR